MEISLLEYLEQIQFTNLKLHQFYLCQKVEENLMLLKHGQPSIKNIWLSVQKYQLKFYWMMLDKTEQWLRESIWILMECFQLIKNIQLLLKLGKALGSQLPIKEELTQFMQNILLGIFLILLM